MCRDHSISSTTLLCNKKSTKFLKRNLDDIKKNTMKLEIENTLFKSFLDEIPPPTYRRASLSELEPEDDDPVARKHRQFMLAPGARYRRLDPENKCLIAHNEYWKCKNYVKQTKKQLEGIINRYEVALQEYIFEIKDIRRAELALQQFVEQGYNERMKCCAAEKFVAFVRDNFRKRDVVYDEIHLQNGVLLCQLRKMRQELRLKAAERDSVSKSDYDKLLLANKQMLESLTDKMNAIAELKLIHAKQLRFINIKRQEMNSHMRQLPKLRSITERKMADIETANANINQTCYIIEDEFRKKQKMTRLKERYKIPTVHDLIEYSTMNKILTNDLKKYDRQMKLAKADFERYQGMWRQTRSIFTTQSFSMYYPEPSIRSKRFTYYETRSVNWKKRPTNK